MPKDRGGRFSYRRRKDQSIWWIAGIAVGATALLIVLSNLSAGGAEIVMPAELKTDAERSADRNVLGDPNAPVELVEYSDFRCPACGQANEVLGPQLKQMAAAGQVKIVHKHMLVIGDKVNSQHAAEAAECAADQGQYWNFHDMLFANQSRSELWSRKTLKNYAKELGLDSQAFNQCLDDKKYEEKVLASSEEGYNTPGITGTPSFLINGTLLKLQRSYNEVVEAITQAG